jgi:hypothetical protein
VGYGSHGKQERIQDLICQACGKKFTLRGDTVLYRLKTPIGKGSSSTGADGRRGGCLNVGEGAGDWGRDAADLADAGGDAC